MSKPIYTHRVAVNAYIKRRGKFLLLKRNQEPYIWAPPGGRLYPDEHPIAGLKREIKEETNFDIEVVMPANTWFGDWNGQPLLSIDYLVRVMGGELTLSPEHSKAAWVSISELKKGKPVSLDPRLGFQVEDFMNVNRLIDLVGSAKLS